MESSGVLEPVSLSGVDCEKLLRHWTWLVPPDSQVICVTQLGDAFLERADGSIWLLSVGLGSVERVANHELEWRQLLRDPEQVDLWSGRVLTGKLRNQGLSLAAGQCYTYWQCPMLGGGYDFSNFKVVGVEQHFDIWGPFLGMVKDLPDGSQVKFVVKP